MSEIAQESALRLCQCAAPRGGEVAPQATIETDGSVTAERVMRETPGNARLAEAAEAPNRRGDELAPRRGTGIALRRIPRRQT